MLLEPDRRDQWNDFVAASAHPTVMQSWQWGELKAATGWEPLLVAVGDEHIRAGALVLKRPLPYIRRCLFYAPRGPVLDWDDIEALDELLSAIRRLAADHRAIALKIDPCVPADRSEVVDALRRRGFIFTGSDDPDLGGTQPRYVMKTDLTPEPEDLLASFHSKWRYNIRLAERKGVAVREGTRDDLPEFYELLQVTAERDRFRVRARDYFERMYDLLVPEGMARLFVAEYEEKMIAGAILFRMGDTAVYVYGASANEHRNLMPNHLLQWTMMCWAREHGCRVYDFRGVTREVDGEPVGDLGGLNRFKRGFAAEYMEYIGEWDLVLSLTWYRLYALAMRRRGE
ncbi:MAG: peptidoglycan bridge formation glycyltransferase FemA/FemB family protein [Armatimonadetes bacterium]|nr:peptidoglycan bridge formation glycyltransferase FemA/FemB family protein [Armatimonadota bacterium]